MKADKTLIELQKIEKLAYDARNFARVETIAQIPVSDQTLPIHAFKFGENKTLPVFALFAGVHGLEKVGTHVAIYFLRSLISRLQWDQQLLQQMKLQLNLQRLPHKLLMFEK